MDFMGLLSRLFFTVIGSIPLILGIVFTIYIVKKQLGPGKKVLETYIKRLSERGFTISKRILLLDFLSTYYRYGSDHLMGTKTGIFLDYPSRKIAIKTSNAETEPHIFSFDDLQDYELLEGNRTVITGTSIGFVNIASHRMKQIDYADALTVRIVLRSGNQGVNSLSIPLFHVALRGFTGGSSVQKNSSAYQSCIECAYSILDELGNILRTANPSFNGATVIQQTSGTEQLTQLKKLLDNGVITQSEFDAKKKQFLGL